DSCVRRAEGTPASVRGCSPSRLRLRYPTPREAVWSISLTGSAVSVEKASEECRKATAEKRTPAGLRRAPEPTASEWRAPTRPADDPHGWHPGRLLRRRNAVGSQGSVGSRGSRG